MKASACRKLPKRLQIDFRCIDPTYELYTKKGCNRRDLATAGLSEEAISALLWNSYAKKEMRYTLVRPEEWFWTDRGWWKTESPHIDAMYEIAGGAFSDLTPREQAGLLGTDFLEMTGAKGRGNLWVNPAGEQLDIVRYTRERLIADGYDMAPAYSESLNLIIITHCKQTYGKDIRFIGHGSLDEADLRRYANLAIHDVVADPAKSWENNGEYYLGIFNIFRKTHKFDRDSMMALIRIFTTPTLIRFYKHYWSNQTYENQMTLPVPPPLVGRRYNKLHFFFVTQKSNFGAAASGFVRDYAKPLGLAVSLVQLTPEQ